METQRLANSSTIGASLMASGLVPITKLTRALDSFPPGFGVAYLAHFGYYDKRNRATGGINLLEVVRVGLKLEGYRGRWHEVDIQALADGVGHCFVACFEIQPNLRVGITRARPAGQRIGV